MVSLLPPNATPLEQALEAVTARISAVPLPTRPLIDPNTCPETLLPWLAWALSMDDWSPDWPVQVKRAQLANAVTMHRSKGTARCLHQVVELFGGHVSLREWWQNDPPGQPHTFEMVLTVSGADGPANRAHYVDDVIAAVRRVKPLRSHFVFTQGLSSTASIGVIGASAAVTYRRLECIAQIRTTTSTTPPGDPLQ